MDTRATSKRSVVKALTYRVIIICLDFVVVYLLTGKAKVAVGFMIISNLYTTVGYFLHERIWSRIRWGIRPAVERSVAPIPASTEASQETIVPSQR